MMPSAASAARPLPRCIRGGYFTVPANFPRLQELFEELRQFLVKGFRAGRFSGPTVVNYSQYHRRFVSYLLSKGQDLSMRHLNAAHVRDFYRTLKAEAPTNRLNFLSAMRGPFQDWKDEHLIEEELTKHVLRPKAKRGLPNPIAEDGLRRLLAAPDTSTYHGARDKVFLEVTYSGALRFNECHSMTWGDIHLPPATEYPYLHVVGKGGDERLAPLSQRAVEALEVLRRHLPQHPRPADYVFRSPHSAGTRLSRAPLAVRFKALCKEVGLPANTHPHQLRHSAAQYSLSRGMPFAIVSKYLGHRWIQTTQIYARATPIEAFEAYFKIYPKFETFGFGEEAGHAKD